jgi:hypothetical protein
MRYSIKCVAKRLCKQCKVKGLLILAIFIAAAKRYISVTNFFKICYRRNLDDEKVFLRIQKPIEKKQKMSWLFWVEKE